MADRALRLLKIVSLIPREPAKRTIGELLEDLAAQGIEVPKRTLQRDMAELMSDDSLKIKRSAPEGPGKTGQGYCFSSETAGLAPRMDTSAALTLTMAGEFIANILPADVMTAIEPQLHKAAESLEDASRKRYAEWKNKVRSVPRYLCFKRPEVDAEVFSKVSTALFENTPIEITYKSREKPYALLPLALVDRGLEMILVAYVEEYKQPRQFMLHRIREVRHVIRNIRPKQPFDLDEKISLGYFSVPVDNDATKPIHLHVKLYRRQDTAEPWLDLAGTPLSEDQQLEVAEDGDSAMLKASVMDTWELRFWILGLGTQAEVLGPRHLRAFCREQAALTLARLTDD